jgi:hypothetical protein
LFRDGGPDSLVEIAIAMFLAGMRLRHDHRYQPMLGQVVVADKHIGSLDEDFTPGLRRIGWLRF